MTDSTFSQIDKNFDRNNAVKTPQIIAFVSTKGGVGKTTGTANTSAVLADMGFSVLIIDADTQPSLSKFYPLHKTAPNGIVEFLLGDNTDENVNSCISKTIYPNLDIVLSNNISGDIQLKIQPRLDRLVLLRQKLRLPVITKRYDFVVIDTQGAVGPLQEAACLAADLLISPVRPEMLTAREFIVGTAEAMLKRLSQASAVGLPTPPLLALIYAQDRTRDAKIITNEIKSYCNSFIDGSRRLLKTAVPSTKAYKEAQTERMPVHCFDNKQKNKSIDCAYDIMHALVYEICPPIAERQLKAACFEKGLLPEEVIDDISSDNGLPEPNTQQNQDNIVKNNDKNGSGCLNENLAPSHHSSPKHSGSLLSHLVSLNQATEWKKGLSITVNEIIRNQGFNKTLSKDDYGKSIDLNKLHFPACFFANDTPIEQIQVAIAYISTCCLDNTSTEKVQALLDEMIDLSVDSPFEYFIELCQTANEANEKGEE